MLLKLNSSIPNDTIQIKSKSKPKTKIIRYLKIDLGMGEHEREGEESAPREIMMAGKHSPWRGTFAWPDMGRHKNLVSHLVG